MSDALINYLVRLGWSYGEEEIFSLEKLQKIFDLSDVNSSPSKYSQDLLNWYNNKYLNFLSAEELVLKVKKNSEIDFSEIINGNLAISLLAKGANSLNQIAEDSIYFFEEPQIKFDALNIDTNKKLLEILVCPKTHSSLVLHGDELISKDAKLAYPIRDGIPIMLIEEARELSQEELDKL